MEDFGDSEAQEYLQYAFAAAQAVTEFISGKTRQSLDDELQLIYALARAIETTARALASTPFALHKINPTIKWWADLEMSDELSYGYFEFDRNLLWVLATEYIPPLLEELKKLLSAS